MKKLLCILLAAVMLLSLAACAKSGVIEDDPATKPGSSTSVEPGAPETPTVDGTYYDTGSFKALVPAGWKEFPASDVFSDEPDALDATALNICKGGVNDYDLFTKPYIYIKYGGPNTLLMQPDKDWYDDVQDIDPLTTGSHTWNGFSGESFGSKLYLLYEDLGEVQLQVTVYYETGEGKLSLRDEDVQAILASIEITDPDAAAYVGEPGVIDPGVPVAESFDYSWWEGDWYGWWSTYTGEGIYEEFGKQGYAWDAYATIDVDGENGKLTLWYADNYKDEPLIEAEVVFYEGETDRGCMMLVDGTFFPAGNWNQRQIEVNPMHLNNGEWTVEPADSSVSHFENMIEIIGTYRDPENEEDAFEYHIFLRPWGMDWADVENGDTSGCIYSDMMPVYYQDWYLPLLELGYTEAPNSLEDGWELIENDVPAGSGASAAAGSLDPAGKDDATGEVDMVTLERGLDWCKNETSYSTTYEEVAAQFGVHGKRELSEFFEDTVFYTWSCGEAYVKVAFKINADGTETWNNTQYDGFS